MVGPNDYFFQSLTKNRIRERGATSRYFKKQRNIDTCKELESEIFLDFIFILRYGTSNDDAHNRIVRINYLARGEARIVTNGG